MPTPVVITDSKRPQPGLPSPETLSLLLAMISCLPPWDHRAHRQNMSYLIQRTYKEKANFEPGMVTGLKEILLLKFLDHSL